MSKSTIIVEGKFRHGYKEHFPEYSETVRRYLAKHGGEVIRRQRIVKTLYGQLTPDLVMVIDLPSREVAESIFFDPEYLAIIPLRDKIFAEFNMYVAAYGDI